MLSDLFLLMPVLWAVAFLAALLERSGWLARILLVLGCLAGIVGCCVGLFAGLPSWNFGFQLSDTMIQFHLDRSGEWLLLFGLIPAFFAAGLGTRAHSRSRRRYWMAGLAMTLLGAFGVFGFQDAMSFLIAWEVMSLGGGAMVLGEGVAQTDGSPVLFMLGLLEVGAVALLLALLLLGSHAGAESFASFTAFGGSVSGPLAMLVGLLLLCGFGAKLGILPFYEWFPAAYGSASGATGVIFSGVVLNAAFYALGRGLLDWLSRSGAWLTGLAIVIVFAGVISAILTIFNAFQEEDWRRLLSLSSAENAGIAVAVLGTSLLFASLGMGPAAGLAWTVCLLHLAGHSLAKGTLFLTADGVYRTSGSYTIRQTGLLRRNSPLLGVGAIFAAMSLAALPPQAGFVSEWYVFQTLFQGMEVHTSLPRLALALAAAGLALVAAVALATFAKLFGVGLLGGGPQVSPPERLIGPRVASVFILGLCVLGLAVGMPWWIERLGVATFHLFGTNAAASMRSGWILVPLSDKFAFISPTKLIIVGPLLALIPIVLFLITRFRYSLRRAPLWSGGRREDSERIATTSLAFSNALRTFYAFIYGPTHNLEREYDHGPYFVKRLIFNQEVAPIFGPYLFSPLTRLVRAISNAVSHLQSGYLNFYNALIGALLVLILALSLFYR